MASWTAVAALQGLGRDPKLLADDTTIADRTASVCGTVVSSKSSGSR